MRIDVLTLFPEIFDVLDSGIIGKARKNNLLDINIHNIRDYSLDKHKKCDDYPYGGGAGMVMTPQPIYDAVKEVDKEHKALRIYLSPKGERVDQQMVKEFSAYDKILFLCGSYEGVDQRVLDLCIDREVSIGDYVLTSGELPALVLINAIARYVPDVLGSSKSVEEESFNDNLLEYPHYTRPQVFMGKSVPNVLISGNHQEIDKFRAKKQVELTRKRRPDLLEKN